MATRQTRKSKKISNIVVHNYVNWNNALKHALVGMIIAMEKLQMQGDALDESDSALENDQNKETVLNMFQDIEKTCELAFTSGPD